MTEEQLKQIEQMPKAILHLHLDGSLRPETVYKWLIEKGEEVTLEEVTKALMVEEDCRDLNEYLEKFSLPGKVLQEESHIEQATYELFEDLAKQNVIYAEIRFAPSKHVEQGLSYDQVVEAAIRGMNKAKQEFGIEGNLILCCMRGDSEQNNITTVDTAEKYLNKGVGGLDLAGAEALYPTDEYKNIFAYANSKKVPFTIHAGEADGPESIRIALEMGAKRIGHGVRCIEDKELMEELRQKQIVLEICPISNLQTNAVVEPHPIDTIYKKGILATVSPDNNSVSNTNIIKEYKYILEKNNLIINDLVNMNINGITGAFLPLDKKMLFKAKINKAREEYTKSSIDISGK